MSRKKVTARRHEHRKRKLERAARFLVGNLVYVVLGGAILLFAGVVIASAQHIPFSAASSQSPAQTSDGWIRLTSKSPSAIIAAARKSSLFTADRSGNGDYLKDLSHLENPVLVRAYQPAGSVPMPDYYVIPIDNAAGSVVGAAELELNKPHTAIQVTAIVTYSAPRPHGYMARVNIGAAIADVSQQRHAHMKAGATAMLVYFPVDARLQEAGKIVWSGGGEYPADPIWLIPGTDGSNYIVGVDGIARHASDLPIMKQP
jgi:hypothetical protein